MLLVRAQGRTYEYGGEAIVETNSYLFREYAFGSVKGEKKTLLLCMIPRLYLVFRYRIDQMNHDLQHAGTHYELQLRSL